MRYDAAKGWFGGQVGYAYLSGRVGKGVVVWGKHELMMVHVGRRGRKRNRCQERFRGEVLRVGQADARCSPWQPFTKQT